MTERIIDFDAQERARHSSGMPERRIAEASDENFQEGSTSGGAGRPRARGISRTQLMP